MSEFQRTYSTTTRKSLCRLPLHAISNRCCSSPSSPLPSLATTSYLLSGCRFLATNVPGPSHKVKLAGAVVDDLYFFVSSGISVSFCIISYNNRVKVSVLGDPTRGFHPQEIADEFADEFAKMYDEVVGSKGELIRKYRKDNAVFFALEEALKGLVLYAVLLSTGYLDSFFHIYFATLCIVGFVSILHTRSEN